MEYFESCSLNKIMHDENINENYNHCENSMNKIAPQLCCAVCYLHNQPIPIIHRDIKPLNILVNKQYSVKLCDLGLGTSSLVDLNLQSTKGRICGTYLYMPLEILLHGEKATERTDIWSLACSLVELYTGKVWNVKKIAMYYLLQWKIYENMKLQM